MSTFQVPSQIPLIRRPICVIDLSKLCRCPPQVPCQVNAGTASVLGDLGVYVVDHLRCPPSFR